MTDATIELRPLAASDHEAWLPLWRGYQAFYKVDIPARVSELTFSRLLDPVEPMHGTLAWRDGEAVGLAHHIFHRSTWTEGDYCYLQDLFVSPEARGGGIARKLIQHVYVEAQRKGCARVYWLTHESNETAIRLYEQVAQRSGFIQYRRSLPL
ncbi:GNAT family N-acetyltransferase [Bosea sp. 117]|uniref:GNAT family N-acetyltransferase n=1 Tax=Bosea sp. 117 TaxID=1125973 RepID=UPI000493B798|nr:GNAT family N-acetyltransferase [Bosea sp. 117]